ncbi:MAG TPA: AI-2E family transporter [Vicinamibacterales bacterium]|nr:AI-2E family transporter [Vicinamibacterales bacterium]
MQTRSPDLTRTFLVLVIIAALIAGSLWTLWPFLGALLWATTIAVATWPLLLKLQHGLGGRRTPAAALMTLAIAAVFLVPFVWAVTVLIDLGVQGVELVRAASERGLQPLPDWVASIPMLGPRLQSRWQELTLGGPEQVADALRPLARQAAGWTIALTGGIGAVTVHFLLTVLMTAGLYVRGEQAAAGVIAFATRINADRGERIVLLAGQAVRGVALGVIVTALLQAVVAGLGLWAVEVPRWGVLLAVTFVLCVAQLGPLLVLLPAAAWLAWIGRPVAAGVLLFLIVAISIMENVVKPMLIRRGVDVPMLLLIAGVLGGLLSFGVPGLFVGPVILAVTYTLLRDWIREGQNTETA